jgi:Pvc16 N-terminal domain
LSTYLAMAATSKTILGLLEDACPKNEFPNARFALYLASDFDKAVLIEEGISLFLYRITINGAIRNLPPRTGPDGRRYRPSLPVDLHYLITAWGKDADKQQRLLGWCMRVLEDTPILPAGLLNHYMRPEKDTFRDEETVELICDPLSLQDWTAVWDKLKPKIQTSVTYVARMIAIESNVELAEARAVQTRGFEMAQVRTQ